jgi:hypothetical protein
MHISEEAALLPIVKLDTVEVYQPLLLGYKSPRTTTIMARFQVGINGIRAVNKATPD